MKSGSDYKKLVIIPAYNEANNILDVVNTLHRYAPNYDYIVINDCSTDSTSKVLCDNNLPHIDLCSNLGIGGAVQTGYKYALKNGYDVAIQLDGDGQHDPCDIDKLVKPIELDEADVVIGSRFINKDGFQSSRVRRCGIVFLCVLVKAISGVKVTDVTSGYRAVNRKMIKEYASNYPQDYPEPEAIIMATTLGASVIEKPVSMKERQSGVSSINIRRAVYYMIKVSLSVMLAALRRRNDNN